MAGETLQLMQCYHVKIQWRQWPWLKIGWLYAKCIMAGVKAKWLAFSNVES